MRILVINPIGDSSWDESDRKFFRSVAAPGTEVDVVSLGKGPPSLESRESHDEVLPLVKEVAMKLHEKYDAVIVNCFLDPGVDALRSILGKPVVGPCEASLAIASMLGRKLAIVSIKGEALEMIEERAKALGYGDRVIFVGGIPTPVTELAKDWEKVKRELVEEVKRAVERGAEVVVLGCTGLAGLSKHVEKEVGVPVVDPAAAVLKAAELIVSLNLRHATRREQRY